MNYWSRRVSSRSRKIVCRSLAISIASRLVGASRLEVLENRDTVANGSNVQRSLAIGVDQIDVAAQSNKRFHERKVLYLHSDVEGGAKSSS